MVQGADPNVPRARKETGTYILDDGDERYDGATSIRQNASVTPVTRRVRAVETVLLTSSLPLSALTPVPSTLPSLTIRPPKMNWVRPWAPVGVY